MANALGRMVDKAVGQRALRSLVVGKEGINISHLQFADDTFFFLDKEEGDLCVLISILDLFLSCIWFED